MRLAGMVVELAKVVMKVFCSHVPATSSAAGKEVLTEIPGCYSS